MAQKTKSTVKTKTEAKTMKSNAVKGKNVKKTTAGKSTLSSGKLSEKKGMIIVESPAKARTIEKFSKGKFIVKASMGHVRDLPKTNLGVDVEKKYEPRYITIRGKKSLIDELRNSAKEASSVLLASDPDREGEAIAWHLANILKVETPLRIEMHEITQAAFNEAVSNPRQIDMNLVNAQQARRVLDRLVGYKLSPLLWRKIGNGLSAGRVQSVAVKLVCDRQKEIDAFVPQEYWSLDLLLAKKKQPMGDEFLASLIKYKNAKIEIPDKATSDKIVEEIKNSELTVVDVKKKDQARSPAPPFKTSTLQQDAFRSLGFKAKKTMMLAQQLYEGIDIGPEGMVGLITYMRTDSFRISQQALTEADEFITQTFGESYKTGGRVYKSTGKTQEAHEAIRPTSSFRTPEKIKRYLSRDQFKLYRLIWNRFIASQMASAIFENTTADIKAGDYLFRATDSKIKFPGYLKVYEMENQKEEPREGDETTAGVKMLPPLEPGEHLEARKYLPKQHFTQPPPPYTEATLIKALEEKGIGRPSTYAPIVDTIQKRGYVELYEKKFRPTNLGETVTKLLEEHFPNIIDVDFTAGLEEKLDKIEEGNEEWVRVIDNFYVPFSETLNAVSYTHLTLPTIYSV